MWNTQNIINLGFINKNKNKNKRNSSRDIIILNKMHRFFVKLMTNCEMCVISILINLNMSQRHAVNPKDTYRLLLIK